MFLQLLLLMLLLMILSSENFGFSPPYAVGPEGSFSYFAITPGRGFLILSLFSELQQLKHFCFIKLLNHKSYRVLPSCGSSNIEYFLHRSFRLSVISLEFMELLVIVKLLIPPLIHPLIKLKNTVIPNIMMICTGGGVTPIGGLVYMCLPGLWVSLRYFARLIGHVL